MSTAPLSQRSLVLLQYLNRRGIRGRAAKTILRKYAQLRVAKQIDYYDHEVVFRGHLPEWAGTPWLEWRIRRDLPAPSDFITSSQSLSHLLQLMPYRPSGRRGVNYGLVL